ncbi:sporulation protein YlmC with PRC-barrel domain [Pelomonas saccharophila]|uniref:Sporulation protein YlmC with PRC-barrel domain n=1 Tax=Roseateles saccharophilus TaxID=304 RepID=A0ABU1YLX5_ROSSA|nr:PRC-barrel domain-containing protein [Roseateles saccharophilus]MDR7269743.1 sporulation protein YlmC with PRC-barrel domain [Roseateles saccharophilus]
MFNSASRVTAAHVRAVDGDIGPVEDLLFDDRNWVIRYLVVDAGTWLAERDVLISPYSIKQPVGHDGVIDVALTRRLIRSSPPLDIERPVSRQQELAFERHYHYPAYWDGGGRWALGAMPYPSIAPRPQADREQASIYPADMQLRSAEQVFGFEIQASDLGIGQVQDFVFDDESWQVRYLVVDTRSWWPAGREVLIALPWVDRIDWAGQQIHVSLTREQVRCSPAYQDVACIHRDYEIQLHANYQRPGYWA